MSCLIGEDGLTRSLDGDVEGLNRIADTDSAAGDDTRHDADTTVRGVARLVLRQFKAVAAMTKLDHFDDRRVAKLDARARFERLDDQTFDDDLLAYFARPNLIPL